MKRVLSPLSAYLPWLMLLAAALPAAAEDWPTYRHDRLRSGVTSESLALPLVQAWEYQSRQSTVAPRFEQAPDWVNYPKDMHYTLPFIAVGDCLYFTSADEGRVACLDAATAEIRWEFIAGGGVNRTPCYSEGKLYFGSNEGIVYCLEAATGEVVWQLDARPTNRMLISYGQMVSVWPVMTDVQIEGGVAYFATGIFPHDGTFLYAVNAENGEVIWRSAHTAENGGRDSLAPGGHLLVTKQQVWVPKDYLGFSALGYGAGIPFTRDYGRFTSGWGMPDDEEFVGSPAGFLPLRGVVVDGVRYTGNIATQENEEKTELWKHDIEGRWVDYDSALGVRMGGKYGLPVVLRYDPDLCNVIYAGGTIFHTAYDIDPSAGQTGIYARDPSTGEVLWTVDLPDPVNQLVVAGGRLFAGTRNGKIYCFAPQGVEERGTIAEPMEEAPLEVTPEIATAAEAIVQATGLENGYALVLDCQDGQLPFELARRTNLYVCATFTDQAALDAARQAYVKAGLQNSRIMPMLVAPGERLPFPSFFADVVVSDAAIRGGELPTDIAELERMTKPIRGIALLSGNAAGDLAEWTAASGLAGWETVEYAGPWAKWVRPELPEAGSWTHMYGDAGQTGSSDDGALKPPLGMLWYGPPYVQFGTDQTPLIVNGILVSPDANSLEGYDQYTGRKLWRLEAGSIGIGRGKLAASAENIYVIYDKVVIRLDLFTGEELSGYRTPFGEEHAWGWMAVAPDGKTIYGAAAGGVWATEMETGQGNIRWQIGGPEASESFAGQTIMDDGKIFILGEAANEELRAAAIEEMRNWFKTQPPELLAEFESQLDERDIRLLTCIDADSGDVLWRHGVDISNCGGKWLRQVNYGSRRGYNPYATLDMYVNNGVVVIGSQGGADKGWGAFNGGQYIHKALTAYDAETGNHLWYKFANYRSRPVIVGDTIHAEPWAYDLHTGERQQREHPITGEQEDWSWCRYSKQCGVFSGSRHFLFGRSMGVGYHDLLNDDGLYTFWHSRASCWMDCASGGGMMIKPPHSLGCQCQWNMPFTIAMGTVDTQPAAAPMFSQTGPTLPVKHLHLDIGGTGDRHDEAGRLWIHPEPFIRHPMFIDYPVDFVQYEGAQSLQRSAFQTEIANADPAFIFASCHIGVKRFMLPVTTEESGPGEYLVRLGFVAPPGDTPGSRVFDVLIDGQPVLEQFDVVAEAGGIDHAVWKEFTLTIDGELMLDFVAAVENPTYEQMPLLCAVEILRQDEIGVGLAAPLDLWLGGSQQEATATLEVTNHASEPFTGKLEVTAPGGITATLPQGGTLSLAAGETREIELPVRAEGGLAEGYHLLQVKVLDEAGGEQVAREMPVEFLGPLERVFVRANVRDVSTNEYRLILHYNLRPPQHRVWMSLTQGAHEAGDFGHSGAALSFGLPHDIAPRVQRARIRLHVSRPATALQRVIYNEDRTGALAAEDFGQIRRVVGPPWPDMNQITPENLAPVEGDAVPLTPVAWNPLIAEVPVPINLEALKEQDYAYFMLEPTSMNGIGYWAQEPPDTDKQAYLLVDYLPAEAE